MSSPSIRINDEYAEAARLRAESLDLSFQAYVNRLVAADIRGQHAFEVLPVGLTSIAEELEAGLSSAYFLLVYLRLAGSPVVVACTIKAFDRTTLTIEFAHGLGSRAEAVPRSTIVCWQRISPDEGPSRAFKRGCALFRAFGAVPHPDVNL